ncbi:hypothetical protein ES703_94949 [subsurface metagenome]
MGYILLSKMPDSGQNRIRRGLAQSAERGVLDHIAQVYEFFDIPLFSPAFTDPCKDLQHALRAYPARGAFAAGFILYKIDKESSHIDHTRIFIHDD